jgi:amino-acid N-acetyltransferase
MEKDYFVREARPDETGKLAKFIEPFVQQRILLPRTEDELQDLAANGFVAEFEGRIVGFAALEVYSQKLAELRSLAVSPEMQGCGVGKRLVQACVERARERDVFEVMAISSSEPFFMSCGFNFTLPDEKKAFFVQLRDADSESSAQ